MLLVFLTTKTRTAALTPIPPTTSPDRPMRTKKVLKRSMALAAPGEAFLASFHLPPAAAQSASNACFTVFRFALSRSISRYLLENIVPCANRPEAFKSCARTKLRGPRAKFPKLSGSFKRVAMTTKSWVPSCMMSPTLS